MADRSATLALRPLVLLLLLLSVSLSVSAQDDDEEPSWPKQRDVGNSWVDKQAPTYTAQDNTYPLWLAHHCPPGALPLPTCKASNLRNFHRKLFSSHSPLNDQAEVAGAASGANYNVALQTGTIKAQAWAGGGTFTYTVSHATGCVLQATGAVAPVAFPRSGPEGKATPAQHVTHYLLALNGVMGRQPDDDVQYDKGHIIAHSLGGDGHDTMYD